MFCDKCGKNLPKGTEVCSRCGTKMPASSACGGFADILSFEGASTEGTVKTEMKNSGHEAEIRRLTEKVNVLAKRSKSAVLISLCTAAACILLTAVALTFSIVSLNAANKAKQPEIVSESVEQQISPTVKDPTDGGNAGSGTISGNQKTARTAESVKTQYDSVGEMLEKLETSGENN